ncbi:MAG: hypothetical protein Q7S03_03365 [bacterium]|nr:hypothetical protein [bacterium]
MSTFTLTRPSAMSKVDVLAQAEAVLRDVQTKQPTTASAPSQPTVLPVVRSRPQAFG